MKELGDLTTRCIHCGFCIEACPTYKISGVETESPRGRIYLVRGAVEGKIGWEDIREPIDHCLGCRACETACPSGVEYGLILELAREQLSSPAPVKALLAGMTNPTLFRLQMGLAGLWPGAKMPSLLGRFISKDSQEANLPKPQAPFAWPELVEEKLPPIREEVFLLEGCVMRVLYPRVHQATRRLLRRVGVSVKPVDLGCCGALHAHAGMLKEAKSLAEDLTEQAGSGEAPIVVNSAGCGSVMKGYGDLIGSEEAVKRVFDVSEFLFSRGLTDLLERLPPTTLRVGYHDACHLAHGQGIRSQPRSLLGAVPGLVQTPVEEADTCCGSAGIYNLLEPKIAAELLARKWGFLEASGAEVVALGNPGCHAWIGQAAKEHGGKIPVLHTVEVVEALLSGLDPRRIDG